MEKFAIDFFIYSIYCLTFVLPIFILERICITRFVKSFFSLGVNSFKKNVENISINIKLDELKNQKISVLDGYFYFAENGLIYFRTYHYNSKGAIRIKGVAKITKGNLKIQAYTLVEHILFIIFLPIIWIAGIIGASYNPDGNAELGFIPLVGTFIFFIFAKFAHKKKFDKISDELIEILAGKIGITDVKKTKNFKN